MGYNLPPGTTDRDIEDFWGEDEDPKEFVYKSAKLTLTGFLEIKIENGCISCTKLTDPGSGAYSFYIGEDDAQGLMKMIDSGDYESKVE